MREIKFRAWLKEPKIMTEVKGSTTLENKIPYGRGKFVTEKLVKVAQKENINALWWCYERDDGEETECEIMQYTGIKDKNGVEIYEGDIVKFAVFDLSFDADENVEKFEKRYEKDEVVFTNGRFIAGIKYGSNESLALMQELEVVGNIYETSEAE